MSDPGADPSPDRARRYSGNDDASVRSDRSGKYGEPFYQMVDAISGELVSLYGNPPGAGGHTAEPTDIRSHRARSALQAAVEHGVLVPDAEGKVYPNKVITTGDRHTDGCIGFKPVYRKSEL